MKRRRRTTFEKYLFAATGLNENEASWLEEKAIRA
jgi:hypothetical protein